MLKNEKTPLLSICIPTLNRSEVLKQTLQRYVDNYAFGDDVEIVITDNCSSDKTQEVGLYYSKKYPNIHYYRNDKNIANDSFAKALDLANGLYLKLINDTSFIEDDALDYMLRIIKMYKESKVPLFFTNGFSFNTEKREIIECNNFDEFVTFLSYYVTSSNTFGAWRDDWAEVKNKLFYTKYLFNHVDWSYQILERKGNAVLLTKKIHNTLDAGVRSGYNWFEVHVGNYYKILQTYVDKGLVSKKALRKEKITRLKGLRSMIVMHYIYNYYPLWQFETKGATKVLWNNFKNIPFFYLMMSTLPIWGGLLLIKHFLKKLFDSVN